MYSPKKALIYFTGTLIVVLTKGKKDKSFGLTISGKLTLSFIMLKNGQTYHKNLVVLITRDF